MAEEKKAGLQDNLGNQGQTWSAIGKLSGYAKPEPIFDRPMEITVGMLRGLRMVDETVVVYGSPTKKAKE